MVNSKIRDMERRLRKLGILGIAIGLVVIGVNLAILILIPGFMPPWGFAMRVLGILVGTTVLLNGMLCLISVRSLAQQTALPAPTRFSSWFTKKRNFVLIILLALLIGFLIVGPLIGFLIVRP